MTVSSIEIQTYPVVIEGGWAAQPESIIHSNPVVINLCSVAQPDSIVHRNPVVMTFASISSMCLASGSLL